MDLDLKDLTGGVGDDGEELDDDVLGVHVQDKVEGEGLLLAGGDRDVVPDGRQVADDIGASRGALGQLPVRAESTADEGDVNGAILLVLDVNQRLGDLAVDELDAKDVGFGEGSRDISLELSLGRRRGRRIAGLGEGERKQSVFAIVIGLIARSLVLGRFGGRGAMISSRFVVVLLAVIAGLGSLEGNRVQHTSCAKTETTRRASSASPESLMFIILPEGNQLTKRKKRRWKRGDN